MEAAALVSSMSLTNFSEMMAASPRRIREVLYSKFGVKAEKKSLAQFSVQAKEDRLKRLHQAFSKSLGKREDEVCRELIRNWLYAKRPMLKAALDFLEVPNKDGLIDYEPEFFKELSAEKTKALRDHLNEQFDAEQVRIYLAFMGAPA